MKLVPHSISSFKYGMSKHSWEPFIQVFFFFRVEANLKLQTASRLFIILCYSFLVLAVWYYWSYAQKFLELQLEVKLLIVLTAIHSNQVHPKCDCRRHRIWTPSLCLLHWFFLLAISNNSIWPAPSPHTLALVRKTKVWCLFYFLHLRSGCKPTREILWIFGSNHFNQDIFVMSSSTWVFFLFRN